MSNVGPHNMKRSLCAQAVAAERFAKVCGSSGNLREAGAGCPSAGGQLTGGGAREASLCLRHVSQRKQHRGLPSELNRRAAGLMRRAWHCCRWRGVRAVIAGCPSVGGQLTVVGPREVFLRMLGASQHQPARSAAIECNSIRRQRQGVQAPWRPTPPSSGHAPASRVMPLMSNVSRHMPTVSAYPWSCFACAKANAAHTSTCQSCGFPAYASGQSIREALAKQSCGSAQLPVQPNLTESVQRALAPLAWWRKALASIGFAAMSGGAVWFKVAFSLAHTGLASLAVVAGGLIPALAYAGQEGRPVIEQNGG